MDLFVCWANVGRSQVAEGFAKNLGKSVISCASVEARKEKYNFKPEKVITKILFDKYNIHINNQEIFYPNDILKFLDKVDNIYLLFDPKKAKQSDKETLIKGKTFWEYLVFIGKEYSIYEIEDPDEKKDKTIEKIVDQIDNLIKDIYK